MQRSEIQDKRSLSTPHSAAFPAGNNNIILIVASSGRMLAQSARRAGLTPIVIDLFGDQDTCELVLELQTVASLTDSALTPVIDDFLARFEISAAVYGSGLEAYPTSLSYLCNRLPLFGNTPQTWQRLHNKPDFFATLDKLFISYPETRFTPPETAEKWLIKPYRSEGGAGIDFYNAVGHTLRAVNSNGGHGMPYEVYWQRHQSGIAMSVLFIADAKQVQIIGFNHQWTTALPGQPFVFSGLINYVKLPDTEKNLINDWLQILTRELSLVGLNSLDFIWDGQQLWVLEINPRPSASVTVYDDSCESGLLATHLAACRGAMQTIVLQNTIYSAYQIISAPKDCRIPEALNWPDWAMDRPQADSFIRAWHPICSIIARGDTPRQTLALLRARQQFIFHSLQIDIKNHAIHSER